MSALNGYLARWRGRDYEASPDGAMLRLYRPDHVAGFEQIGPGRYRRLVPATEVDWFGYRRTIATLRGERVVLLAEDGDGMLVEWDGQGERAPDWWPGGRAEPGVHWARVDRAELTDPREERLRGA